MALVVGHEWCSLPNCQGNYTMKGRITQMSSGPYDEYQYEIVDEANNTYSITGWDDDTDDEPPTDDADVVEDEDADSYSSLNADREW